MAAGTWLFRGGLVAVLGAAVAGSTYVSAVNSRSDDYAFFDPLIEVKSVLNQRFVDDLDERELQLGAIRGMLETLHDDYTVYVPGTLKNEFEKEILGEYVGIGAQILIEDNYLKIVSPLEDSPAFAAGLMPDDRVIEIEGKSTFGLSTQECADLLTGKPGTPVSLLVERAGASGPERLTITITRDQIKTRAVKGFHRLPSGDWEFMIDHERGIGYIRLTQFTPRCSDEVKAALDALGAPAGGLKGLVLDLRGNPGGVLQDAVAIADMFLDSGIIVSTRGRAFPEEVDRARKTGTLPDFPMVVMVNESSASASEVLSGALVDNDRAIVLGTRSFGKGSVQSVQMVPSTPGDQIKVTERRYYLPSGRSIQRKPGSPEWGVDPTPGFYVPISDEQFREMLGVRREQEILRVRDGQTEDAHWGDPDWIIENLKDPQLAAAVKAVRLRLENGAWQPTGEQGLSGNEQAAQELADLEVQRDRIERALERVAEREEQLRTASGDVAPPTPPDFVPDNAAMAGGTMELRDASGNVVAKLRITRDDIERWLVDAPLENDAKGDAAGDAGE
ncbi:MAG: S41 family peptidase [Phycisphaerales bacterium]|jgi:carboxyl-terminal processing protease|nr:S41 family peptidase [Phycisphaerales bacterium]